MEEAAREAIAVASAIHDEIINPVSVMMAELSVGLELLTDIRRYVDLVSASTDQARREGHKLGRTMGITDVCDDLREALAASLEAVEEISRNGLARLKGILARPSARLLAAPGRPRERRQVD